MAKLTVQELKREGLIEPAQFGQVEQSYQPIRARCLMDLPILKVISIETGMKAGLINLGKEWNVMVSTYAWSIQKHRWVCLESDGYSFSEEEDARYKFHTEFLSWSRVGRMQMRENPFSIKNPLKEGQG